MKKLFLLSTYFMWCFKLKLSIEPSPKRLVRFPNPHYVVGWGTEPLHRG